MQFPGMYHIEQLGRIPRSHHRRPAICGDVGVGMAAGWPAIQVNAYQQP